MRQRAISKCMLRSNKRNYRRSARAVRNNKYKYISTLIVDDIHGTSEIANHLKTKFSGLYNSVPTSEEIMAAIVENIDIDIQKYCSSKIDKMQIMYICTCD